MSLTQHLHLEEGLKLPLVEDFYTIQGEGRHAGEAAYFIRVAGCDVGCPWCDAQYTWNLNRYRLTDITEVLARVKASEALMAVITGGEPTLYPLKPLADGLHALGIAVNLETSGTHPLTGDIDWICLSPKRRKAPLEENLRQAHELKVVISDESDFEWAELNAQSVSPHCLLYLQVEWSQTEKMMPRIVDYVKAHPKWRVSIQTHKYMNIP